MNVSLFAGGMYYGSAVLECDGTLLSDNLCTGLVHLMENALKMGTNTFRDNNLAFSMEIN